MGRASTNVDDAIYDLLVAQCPAMWLGFPIGNGRVYFVDGINGNNANVGTRPSLPWQTITYALTQCVNLRNDYIIVLNSTSAVEPGWPVAVNITRVHIIGLPGSNNGYQRYMRMVPVGDFAAFSIAAAGHYSEIAGFDLGGGNTNPCIILDGCDGVWIHDNWFGNALKTVTTPQDGIRMTANIAADARIERNKFIGSDLAVGGGITRDGIRDVLAAAGTFYNSEVMDNIFQACPGIAINLVSAGVDPGAAIISGNKILCNAAAANGTGITLNTGGNSILIDDNRAMYLGGPGGPAFNPFRDISALTHHWGINWVGIAPTYPVLV